MPFRASKMTKKISKILNWLYLKEKTLNDQTIPTIPPTTSVQNIKINMLK